MNQTMINVQRFTKKYGDFVAVDGISFDVASGEIFGLLGPNGAGKTTTLECLEGLRSPDSGILSIEGIDPARDASKLRHVIGVQLQTSGLPDSISAAEAMKFSCAYHGIAPNYGYLDQLGLAEKRNTPYYQLSTGQKRRLALALAVSHNPTVLFLDEPTAGLDVASRSELHSLMRSLRDQGTTILLATHDMAEAEDLADRVAILLDGSIATIGTPMEITATGSELTRISVRTTGDSLSLPDLAFPAVQKQAHQEEYVVYYSTDIGPTVTAIIDYVQNNGDSLVDLRVERPSLEERFLEITHNGASK